MHNSALEPLRAKPIIIVDLACFVISIILWESRIPEMTIDNGVEVVVKCLKMVVLRRAKGRQTSREHGPALLASFSRVPLTSVTRKEKRKSFIRAYPLTLQMGSSMAGLCKTPVLLF